MNYPGYDKGPGRQLDERASKALRSALIEIFYTETIGHCHVDEAVEHLLRLPRSSISVVLSLVRLISFSVSDLLAFSFMENVGKVVERLDPDQMHQWVLEALSIYEADGLQPAKEYLENADQTALKFSGMEQVVELEQMASRLGFLAAGMTGSPLAIKKGRELYTDTSSIFLPATLSHFPSEEANCLLYRMMAVHKCAQIRYRSFYIPVDQAKGLIEALELESPKEFRTGIECLIGALQKRSRVTPLLYALCDTIRIEARLERDFPGLARDLRDLKNYIFAWIPKKGSHDDSGILLHLVHWILRGCKEEEFMLPSQAADLLLALKSPKASAIEVAKATMAMMPSIDQHLSYRLINRLLPYMGTIRPEAIGFCLERRRQEVEKRFVEIIGALLLKKWQKQGTQDRLLEEMKKVMGLSFVQDGEQALAMLMDGRKGEADNEAMGSKDLAQCLFLDVQDERFREELEDLISEIKADLGNVPMRYISSAVGLASGAWTDLDVESTETEEVRPLFKTFTYDEWDFRRQAYRQNWCLVKELEVPGTGGDFVEKALRKHKGQLSLLLRQFEMLRPEYRFLKRQAEGEDIDIDAVVEAWADIFAQRSPSEHLFVRQMRRERNIAVLFLVDMSASTEGWINQSIKEALILLCQCMELLDDKYAICGFSGMRRTSCHFFRIKDFEQAYDEGVKSRIGGINPRDYTRMGPAIRHATAIFRQVEARLRILVTLSDGKPEDYDEYKGPYAIEDTRRALLETREEGIRPFCITIDKEARGYLSHMYGERNYIFIKDVGTLHRRVAEIYRLLTT